MTYARPQTETKTKEEWKPHLIGGYIWDEVTSSLQKMIRRGREYEAVYWAYVLHRSGYGQYLWRRLSIIACEDIGNGEPLIPVVIDSLAGLWERLHKHNKIPSLDKFLLVVQAVLCMCRAKKSRENDSLSNLIEEDWKQGERLKIPEVAKDCHTEIGKLKYGKFGDTDGREKLRLDRWFNINARIENEAYPDKWLNQLKKIWYSKAKNIRLASENP